MRRCIYCWLYKADQAFSDEHIWPDALGGDFLSSLWRTADVCQTCNSMSGVFVDGAFIKSWMGNAERAAGSREYLSRSLPGRGILPLDYLGRLQDAPISSDQVAELWSGPCGANIIHIRPSDSNDDWATYAGGDPRTKKPMAGRAYIVLTSEEPFWIVVSLASFKAHFKKAERLVVNMNVPPQWFGSFKNVDRTNKMQLDDMRVVDEVIAAGRAGQFIRARVSISRDLGNRFLAKLALAIGYKLLGEPFLDTDYAEVLRRAFREADFEKRKRLPVRGTGYLHSHGDLGVGKPPSWPGGWVLLIKVANHGLILSVVSPSGTSMNVLVCDKPELVARLDPAFLDGQIWLTVPAVGEAVGPIPLPDYLAYQLNETPVPELSALANKRSDPASLPPCGSADGEN